MAIATSAAIALGVAAGTAGGAAASGYFAGRGQTQAAEIGSAATSRSADLQKQANDEALAFQRQQAEAAWRDSQRVEQANYAQNAAHEQRLSTVGQLLGFGARDIPAYVPGVDPHFDTGATPLPSTSPQSAGAALSGQGSGPASSPQAFIAQWQATHAPSEGVQPLLNAMKSAGFNVAPYLYGSTPSNNEISLDGTKYKVLGAEGTPNAYWYQPGTNDSAGPSSAATPSVGAYLAQAQPTPFQPLPVYGHPYEPKVLSVGSYLGG